MLVRIAHARNALGPEALLKLVEYEIEGQDNVTPEQMTERSSKLLEQFDGLDTGSVITTGDGFADGGLLRCAQGGRHAHDSCIMVDAAHDAQAYDVVQGMREMVSKVMPGHKGNGQ